MKKIVNGILISGVILGIGWGRPIVGQASNYSASRANSVRLVWRHHMGRHAYHTVKGARYSKHLGVKYASNDDLPEMTWYTDAHEKLYNKAKRTSAIYYHVKSDDGQHGGWIWRGYLTAGVVKRSTESSGSSTLNSDENLAEQMIQRLGHGAHPDPQSMDKANSVLKLSLNGQYKFLSNQELFPTSVSAQSKTENYTIVRNFNVKKIANHMANRNEIAFYNLLSSSKISMDDRSFTGGYYIQSKMDTLNILRANYEASPEFFGKKGLTSANYFIPVKIGVAVKNIEAGRYAAFVMLHYPEKYWDLHVDD